MSPTVARKTTTTRTRRSRGPFPTYNSAMKYLFSSTDYERTGLPRGYNIDNFSLDRMRRLLGKLGAPHRMLNAVHIAGTKGKGSTAAMLAAMLQGSGFRVGLYTSPHLVELREEFQDHLLQLLLWLCLSGKITRNYFRCLQDRSC